MNISIIKKMKVNITMKYHLTSVRMSVIKEANITRVGGYGKKGILSQC